MGLTQYILQFAAITLILSERVYSQETINPYSPNSEVELITPRRNYQPTYVMPDDFFIRKAAVDSGMDPDAVSEVLKTKKPVVKTINDGQGTIQTITYVLEPDGRISKKTTTRKQVRINSDVDSTNPFESIWHRRIPTNGYDLFSSDPFESPFEIQPQPETKTTSTHIDEQGRTVKTTTHTRGRNKWTTTNIEYPTRTWIENDLPKYPERTTSTHDAEKPDTNKEHSIPTPPPLPSLEDFLKTQYSSNTPKSSNPTTLNTTPKTLATIDIAQIPITAILTNGKEFPINMPTGTKSITNIAPANRKPPTKLPENTEFDDILKEAGLSEDDIKNIPEISIVKERTTPDGNVIKTTYKLKNKPSSDPSRHPSDNSATNKNNSQLPTNISKTLSYTPITSTTSTSSTTSTTTSTISPKSTSNAVSTTTRIPPLVPPPKHQIPTPHFSATHSGAIFPTNETPKATPKTPDSNPKNKPSTDNKEPDDITDPDFWNMPEMDEKTTTPATRQTTTTALPSAAQAKRPQLPIYTPKYPSRSFNRPIHPHISAAQSPIDDFLDKVNLKASDFTNNNGEITLRFIDKDGRILTANLILSTVK